LKLNPVVVMLLVVPAMAALGYALQRLVLPAVHWMDDTRAFGILRPRIREPNGQR